MYSLFFFLFRDKVKTALKVNVLFISGKDVLQRRCGEAQKCVDNYVTNLKCGNRKVMRRFLKGESRTPCLTQ